VKNELEGMWKGVVVAWSFAGVTEGNHNEPQSGAVRTVRVQPEI
jgi:hypothetical protein